MQNRLLISTSRCWAWVLWESWLNYLKSQQNFQRTCLRDSQNFKGNEIEFCLGFLPTTIEVHVSKTPHFFGHFIELPKSIIWDLRTAIQWNFRSFLVIYLSNIKVRLSKFFCSLKPSARWPIPLSVTWWQLDSKINLKGVHNTWGNWDQFFWIHFVYEIC